MTSSVAAVCYDWGSVQQAMTSGGHGMRQIAIIGFGCRVTLTAVLLITPVGTVTEAVAAEASDDAVDTISAGEERRGALWLDLSWGQMERWGEGGGKKNNGLVYVMMQQLLMHYVMFYNIINLDWLWCTKKEKDPPIRPATDTTVCSKIKTSNRSTIIYCTRFKQSNCCFCYGDQLITQLILFCNAYLQVFWSMTSKGWDPEHKVLIGEENKLMTKTKRANRAGECLYGFCHWSA